MAEHHGAEHGQAGGTEIHLPSPTLAPPIVGLGVMILSFGVLALRPSEPNANPPFVNPIGAAAMILLIVGALLMAGGIALWLINDAREFVKAGDHGGHH